MSFTSYEINAKFKKIVTTSDKKKVSFSVLFPIPAAFQREFPYNCSALNSIEFIINILNNSLFFWLFKYLKLF